jgi:hypothetical protein
VSSRAKSLKGTLQRRAGYKNREIQELSLPGLEIAERMKCNFGEGWPRNKKPGSLVAPR